MILKTENVELLKTLSVYKFYVLHDMPLKDPDRGPLWIQKSP